MQSVAISGERGDSAASGRFSNFEPEFHRIGTRLLQGLQGKTAIELRAELAEPWCHEAAMSVTGASSTDRQLLCTLARDVFEGAGNPLCARAVCRSRDAVLELSSHVGPHQVQVFTAVSQSLRALLVNSWYALLEQRAVLTAENTSSAVEELLRYAGPARAVFRFAAEDCEIGDVAIPAGDALVLRLDLANRDPSQFESPDVLMLDRSLNRHLALGAGQHPCPGAGLIRAGLSAGLSVFAERFTGAEVVSAVSDERYAIQSLTELHVQI